MNVTLRVNTHTHTHHTHTHTHTSTSEIYAKEIERNNIHGHKHEYLMTIQRKDTEHHWVGETIKRTKKERRGEKGASLPSTRHSVGRRDRFLERIPCFCYLVLYFQYSTEL